MQTSPTHTRAIQVRAHGEPEVMQLHEAVALPELGADQVLIHVLAAGINPVDTYIRAGAYGALPELPYTPGWECAGVVLAMGQAVEGLSVGQRVYTTRTISGAYAEHAIAQASFTHPLPHALSAEEGAALGIAYGTAYRALHQTTQVERGQRVLIHGGAGGVGWAAVQLALDAGLRVVATASQEEHRVMLREAGVEVALDHQDPAHMEAAFDALGGFELVVEVAAHLHLDADLDVLAPGGCVAVVGCRGSLMINPRKLMGKETSVRGVMIYGASASQREAMHAAIAQGVERGALRPQAPQRLELSQAAQAHRALEAGAGSRGKLVLVTGP